MLLRILLFMIFATNLISQTFSFVESRYIDAFERELKLEGFISFVGEQIVIEYIKPKERVIVYFNDMVSSQDANGYEMVDFAKSPSIYYLFMLIKALHVQDKNSLDSFFEWVQNGDIAELLPKDVASGVVEKASVLYENSALKYIHVELKNSDRIKIEIVKQVE